MSTAFIETRSESLTSGLIAAVLDSSRVDSLGTLNQHIDLTSQVQYNIPK
jgi:hypothetical protein